MTCKQVSAALSLDLLHAARLPFLFCAAVEQANNRELEVQMEYFEREMGHAREQQVCFSAPASHHIYTHKTCQMASSCP
jgi:hypothetical protein